MYKNADEIRKRIKEVEEIFKETRRQRIAFAKRMEELGIRVMERPIPLDEEVDMDSSQETRNWVFTKGQVITLIDPWQVADVVEVSEDGSRGRITYYDARLGEHINKRWVGRDEIMEKFKL